MWKAYENQSEGCGVHPVALNNTMKEQIREKEVVRGEVSPVKKECMNMKKSKTVTMDNPTGRIEGMQHQ